MPQHDGVHKTNENGDEHPVRQMDSPHLETPTTGSAPIGHDECGVPTRQRKSASEERREGTAKTSDGASCGDDGRRGSVGSSRGKRDIGDNGDHVKVEQGRTVQPERRMSNSKGIINFLCNSNHNDSTIPYQSRKAVKPNRGGGGASGDQQSGELCHRLEIAFMTSGFDETGGATAAATDAATVAAAVASNGNEYDDGGSGASLTQVGASKSSVNQTREGFDRDPGGDRCWSGAKMQRAAHEMGGSVAPVTPQADGHRGADSEHNPASVEKQSTILPHGVDDNNRNRSPSWNPKELETRKYRRRRGI
ncbi:unnamed protein product [Pylaiella littoralis]